MKDKEWFKPRGYRHITPRLNSKEESAWVDSYVRDPNRIAKHPFFPLIHKKITQRRYKIVRQNKEGRNIRSNTQKTKKIRPIHFATHLDAHVYAFYAVERIQKPYEAFLSKNPGLSDCISAYRKIPVTNKASFKNNIHLAGEVFCQIRRKKEGCCALAFDIENFFNSLDHSILKKAWCNLLGTRSLPRDHYNIFKSITKFHYVMLNDLRLDPSDPRSSFDERKLARIQRQGVYSFFENAKDFREQIAQGRLSVYVNQVKDNNRGSRPGSKGIPQGLPISATLANLYLLDFDQKVYQRVVHELKGFYRRYSDDIVIICDQERREEVVGFVENSIREFKLEIASSKTEVCFFRPEPWKGENRLVPYVLRNGNERPNVPFRYLGFEFYGNRILIKSTKLSKFYRRLKSAVKVRVKRMEHWQQKKLDRRELIFKKKLIRTFTWVGSKPHRYKTIGTVFRYDQVTGQFIPKREKICRKYRGNVLTYARRAAEILEEPGILRQFRRSERILEAYLKERLRKSVEKK